MVTYFISDTEGATLNNLFWWIQWQKLFKLLNLKFILHVECMCYTTLKALNSLLIWLMTSHAK